jgi:hypothetical protein
VFDEDIIKKKKNKKRKIRWKKTFG